MDEGRDLQLVACSKLQPTIFFFQKGDCRTGGCSSVQSFDSRPAVSRRLQALVQGCNSREQNKEGTRQVRPDAQHGQGSAHRLNGTEPVYFSSSME